MILLVSGCYVGERQYDDNIRDYDGDGVLAERFGGRDCDDTNADIGDCDADRDGARSLASGGTDCDDADAAVNPDAQELCNGKDDDCNGLTDDDDDAVADPLTWYLDVDGDGFGDPLALVLGCTQPEGAVAPRLDPISQLPLDDCDDTAPDVYPTARERCDDIDHDCDGEPRGANADAVRYFADADGDGQGNPDSFRDACEPPEGYVSNSLDCDDGQPLTFLGAVERCNLRDDNCNGSIDEGATDAVQLFEDNDGDGVGGALRFACAVGPGVVATGGDCNDTDPDTFPGALEQCGDSIRQDCSTLSPYDCDGDGFEAVANGGTDCDDTRKGISPLTVETCNGRDDDCDGLVDDEDSSVDRSNLPDWYLDQDHDGYGLGGPIALAQCSAPSADSAPVGGDCNDQDPVINPESLWHLDADGDGYGSPSVVSAPSCAPPSTGGPWVINGTDCNDSVADINPNTAWYLDQDGDSFGQSGVEKRQCAQPLGYVRTDGDCDDQNTLITNFNQWYPDADNDGFGDANVDPIESCVRPAGAVANSTDCVDDPLLGGANISPTAPELCDGVDNDCDGLVDDEDPLRIGRAPYYPDLDGDGFGVLPGTYFCDAPGIGWVPQTGDCNDNEPLAWSGAYEDCTDGIDNDCNGELDGAQPGAGVLWYVDTDGDGYGSASGTTVSCTQPAGYAPNAQDCNDNNAAQNPNTLWLVDHDRDGYPDEFEPGQMQCAQPIGYALPPTSSGVALYDCDDTRAQVNPGVPVDICLNGLDDNCNGFVDAWDATNNQQIVELSAADQTAYLDDDGDTFAGNVQQRYCSTQQLGRLEASNYLTGLVLTADCNDNDANINPFAIEDCDGIDNNCVGGISDEPRLSYFFDNDNDGYGANGFSQLYCFGTAPTGWVHQPGDCDDYNPSRNPGKVEICNSIDDDCNGQIDEGVGSLFYPDADNDGVGADSGAISACLGAAPSGYVPDSGDCNDSRPDIGTAFQNHFPDSDGDGYGIMVSANTGACPSSATPLYSFDSGDCDDSDPELNPSTMWYLDGDGDGHGVGLPKAGPSCTDPSLGLYVALNDDCDDFNPAYYPGQTIQIPSGQPNAPIMTEIGKSCSPVTIELAAGSYSEDLLFSSPSYNKDVTIIGLPANNVPPQPWQNFLPGKLVGNSAAGFDEPMVFIGPFQTEPITIINLNLQPSPARRIYRQESSAVDVRLESVALQGVNGSGVGYVGAYVSGGTLTCSPCVFTNLQNKSGTIALEVLNAGTQVNLEGGLVGTSYHTSGAPNGGNAVSVSNNAVLNVQGTTFNGGSLFSQALNTVAISVSDATLFADGITVTGGSTNGNNRFYRAVASTVTQSGKTNISIKNSAIRHVVDAGFYLKGSAQASLSISTSTVSRLGGPAFLIDAPNFEISGNKVTFAGLNQISGSQWMSCSASMISLPKFTDSVLWQVGGLASATCNVSGNNTNLNADIYPLFGKYTLYGTYNLNEDLQLVPNSPYITRGAFAADFAASTNWYADTDNDGLPDGWEAAYFGPPTEETGTDNNDTDGLNNLAELDRGTNPGSPDTDGDGIFDDLDACPLDNNALAVAGFCAIQ